MVRLYARSFNFEVIWTRRTKVRCPFIPERVFASASGVQDSTEDIPDADLEGRPSFTQDCTFPAKQNAMDMPRMELKAIPTMENLMMKMIIHQESRWEQTDCSFASSSDPNHDFLEGEDYDNERFFQLIDDIENKSEDEGLDDYKKGGYHTVYVGEVLIDRYVIMQKLGWGHFSTVWLARDFKYGTYVAIKVQKSANHYLDAAYDEVELLQKAAKYSTSNEWKERLRKIHGVSDTISTPE